MPEKEDDLEMPELSEVVAELYGNLTVLTARVSALTDILVKKGIFTDEEFLEVVKQFIAEEETGREAQLRQFVWDETLKRRRKQ